MSDFLDYYVVGMCLITGVFFVRFGAKSFIFIMRMQHQQPGYGGVQFYEDLFSKDRIPEDPALARVKIAAEKALKCTIVCALVLLVGVVVIITAAGPPPSP